MVVEKGMIVRTCAGRAEPGVGVLGLIGCI